MSTPGNDERAADAAVHHLLNRLHNTAHGRAVLADLDDFTLRSAEAMSQQHVARQAQAGERQ